MRKSSKVTNVILVLLCIALAVILGGLLVTNHKEVRQESERLQKLSEKQETGIDNYEAVKEHASELEEEAGEEENTEAQDSSKTEQKAETSDKASSADKSSESGENADKSNTESKDSEKK